MLHLVILLLASGCVSCDTIRMYYPIHEEKTWDEAQSYCREHYTDLATVSSHDDMKTLGKAAAASSEPKNLWIGLRETAEMSWLWSLGETSPYANWAAISGSSGNCGGMRTGGQWVSKSCESEHPFVCQEGVGPDAVYKVVHHDKTWREAQKFCRWNHTDLANVMSQTENQAIETMVTENVPSPLFVWIGLFRDGWKWSDTSSSSFRYWSDSQPNDDGICTLYYPNQKTWYDRGCSDKHPFCCYNFVERREKKILRVEVESDSSVDFSDPAVREGILKHYQQKPDGVKLQWRVQPDGKIFHKKEKKKISKAC